MVIRLHDAALLERDLLNHLAQAIHYGALHLVFGRTWIDDVAANISRDPDLVDLDLLVRVNGDFGGLGKIPAMAPRVAQTVSSLLVFARSRNRFASHPIRFAKNWVPQS